MTDRATGRVTVDWQVEAQGPAAARHLLARVRGYPYVSKALPVQFAPTPGLETVAGGSSQRTGPGRVLGLPRGYSTAFPGQLRPLSGSAHGVLLAQQTAANLHARPGDSVRIGRPGGGAATVKVDGVVDLPAADELFQKVGAPPGAQPQAPPDNVILLPRSTFDRVESPLASTRPELIQTQVHARVDRALPASPSAAFNLVSGRARNLEIALTGSGLVGDNLGAALDKARSDALYAQILFLFLGLPGAVLAGLVTATVASAGAATRRRDAALLRARGASTRHLVRIALAEALLAGAAGVVAGLGCALLVGQAAFSSASFGAGTQAALLWAGGAAASRSPRSRSRCPRGGTPAG
jgi:putative ABC transport system permease protein